MTKKQILNLRSWTAKQRPVYVNNEELEEVCDMALECLELREKQKAKKGQNCEPEYPAFGAGGTSF